MMRFNELTPNAPVENRNSSSLSSTPPFDSPIELPLVSKSRSESDSVASCTESLANDSPRVFVEVSFDVFEVDVADDDKFDDVVSS